MGAEGKGTSLLSVLGATKITPQFPDCHQHKPDNPPVHFCSCSFTYVVIPNILTERSCQNKTNSLTTVMGIFSMKTAQSAQVKQDK